MARALLAVGSSGAFTPAPAIYPPTDNSWTRYSGNPVLSPTGWESPWLLESTVIYEGGLFKQVYTGHSGGGFTSSQFGYATSPDGITWTRDAGNPFFGLGAGGRSGPVFQPNLFKVGSTYYLFYRSPGPDFLCVATATTLPNFTTVQTNIITNPDGQTQWNNTSIVINGGTWYMLAEGLKGSYYRTYLWTSSDGVTWTAGNGGAELIDLAISAGTYGGPDLWLIHGTWHVWYHAVPTGGVLPTNIYHSTSADLINWATPNLVMSYGVQSFEVDQVADPSIVVVGGTAYLFYNGSDNTAEVGSTGLATAPAVP